MILGAYHLSSRYSLCSWMCKFKYHCISQIGKSLEYQKDKTNCELGLFFSLSSSRTHRSNGQCDLKSSSYICRVHLNLFSLLLKNLQRLWAIAILLLFAFPIMKYLWFNRCPRPTICISITSACR